LPIFVGRRGNVVSPERFGLKLTPAKIRLLKKSGSSREPPPVLSPHAIADTETKSGLRRGLGRVGGDTWTRLVNRFAAFWSRRSNAEFDAKNRRPASSRPSARHPHPPTEPNRLQDQITRPQPLRVLLVLQPACLSWPSTISVATIDRFSSLKSLVD